MLLAQSGGQYLNYTIAEHRAVVMSRGWSDSSKLIVLDEIHKMPDWKSWLKGVYELTAMRLFTCAFLQICSDSGWALRFH